jgi:hypothetical protein
MQKKPKENEALDTEIEEKEDSCEEDQKRRSYYYDDAYGYESYGSDDEEADED